MINKKYWDMYYGFWDRFVKDWFDQRPDMPIDKVSATYMRCVKGLEFDELPEPYLGTPHEGVKAVIINLNPGMSQRDEHNESLERQKFYTLKDTYCGKGPFVTKSLVREFAEDYNMQYCKFIQKWSCLNPKYRQRNTNLCGVKWWQGTDLLTIGGRMKWLGRIYEKKLEAVVGTGQRQLCPSGAKDLMHPLEVFAPELCPYHSRSFSFADESMDDEFLGIIAEHVIRPALNAVAENKLDFAVAIGKPCAIIFEELGCSGKFGIYVKLEKEWWDESDEVVNWGWPSTKDKKTGELRRVHRKYCLFAIKDKKSERLARFLVCVAPGSNGTPSKEFKKIEGKIICYVRNNSLTDERYEKLRPCELRWWSFRCQRD